MLGRVTSRVRIVNERSPELDDCAPPGWLYAHTLTLILASDFTYTQKRRLALRCYTRLSVQLSSLTRGISQSTTPTQLGIPCNDPEV